MNTPRIRPRHPRTARARQAKVCRARAARTDELRNACRDLYAIGCKLKKVAWCLQAVPNGEDLYWELYDALHDAAPLMENPTEGKT